MRETDRQDISLEKKRVDEEMKQSKKAKFIIIGSGFAGIIAAARLQQVGERDMIILELSLIHI